MDLHNDTRRVNFLFFVPSKIPLIGFDYRIAKIMKNIKWNTWNLLSTLEIHSCSDNSENNNHFIQDTQGSKYVIPDKPGTEPKYGSDINFLMK